MKPNVRVCLVASMLCLSLTFYGQLQPQLEKKIQLGSTQLRMDSLLQQLSKQSSIQFSFNSRRISPSKTIRFAAKEQTVLAVLKRLQQALGIQYKIVGSHVILSDNLNRTASTKKANSSQVAISSSKKEAAPVTNAQDVRVKNMDTGTLENRSALQVTRENKNRDTAHLRDTATTLQRDTVAQKDTIAVTRRMITSPVPIGDARDDKNEYLPGNRASSRSLFEKAGLEISPRGVGINYIFQMARSSQVEISTGFGAGYFVTGKNFYYTLQLQNPAFYISINPQFFIGDREASSFYWGGQLHFRSAQLFSRSGQTEDTAAKWISVRGYTYGGYFIDVHGGYQRRLGERWRLNGHLGIGYGFSTKTAGWNHWYPALGIRLSYALKK